MALKAEKMNKAYFENHMPQKKYSLDDFEDGKVSTQDMQRFALMGYALSVVVWHRGLHSKGIQEGKEVRGATVDLNFLLGPNEGFEELRAKEGVLCCLNWQLIPVLSDTEIEEFVFALGAHQEC